MPDAPAFVPDSEYAFPGSVAGEDDDAAQSAQRNQQIQAAFDANRFQRGQSQNVGKYLANQEAQIAQLRARQAQQKNS